jgi:dephospho-CoA kinase
MRHAVLIIGKMRAGKTTMADYLVDNFGFKKYSLATPLKQLYAEMGYGKAQKDREWLQRMGWSLKQVFGELIFVNYLLDNIFAARPDRVVVDDVRFSFELGNLVKALKREGYRIKIVLVTVDEKTQIERGAAWIDDVSEEYAKELEHWIANEAPDRLRFLEAYPIDTLDGTLPMKDYLHEVSALLFEPYLPYIES